MSRIKIRVAGPGRMHTYGKRRIIIMIKLTFPTFRAKERPVTPTQQRIHDYEYVLLSIDNSRAAVWRASIFPMHFYFLVQLCSYAAEC